MGKKYSICITVSMTLETLNKLDQYCMLHEVTRSSVVVDALQDRLKNFKLVNDNYLGGKDNG